MTATAAAFLLLASRRIDAISNPQFWAEDGRVWYADAYNNGVIYSLFTSEAGYFQTVSRMVAIFAQLFPLSWGPLLFNLAAIGVKLAAVNFIISSRLSNVLPSVLGRCTIAFIYIALPHSFETHANLTNVQWHLAFLAFLILISDAPKSLGWKAFDVSTLLLSVLSGPLCILLLPVALLKLVAGTRDRRVVLIVAAFALGSVIQIASLLTSERPSTQPLGVSFDLFFKIIAGHWFISATFGEIGHEYLVRHSLMTTILAVAVVLISLFFLVRAFWKAGTELRMLLAFSVLVVTAAMLSPAITNDAPQWTVMWLPRTGSRYWLIPIFAWFVSLLLLAARDDRRGIRYTAAGVLFLSISGMIADWRYPPFRDLDFQSYAARFESSAPGEETVVPINPNWEMRLFKK